MSRLPWLNDDPQETGPQYLEDLATGYWFSEVLFTAVEQDIFTLIDSTGKTGDEVSGHLGLALGGTIRFLNALCAMGLLTSHGSCYFNTGISAAYLVRGKDKYQGESILWRKNLSAGWNDLGKCLTAGGRVNGGPSDEKPEMVARRIRKYIKAMDCVAKTKVREILPLFGDLPLRGKMLDVGAGSGAVSLGFLEVFPELTAVLMDLPEVLEVTREFIDHRGLQERAVFCSANILESWPVEKGSFDLIILSNIVHAYAEEEICKVLEQAAECLTAEGIMIIHDFFHEHGPEKAAVFDLNMLINTYNGKVFSARWVQEQLDGLKLFHTGLVPLASDTGIILAAKQQLKLDALLLDPVKALAARIKRLGFRHVHPISVETILVADWVNLKCRFGCSGYAQRHCPPNSPGPQQTRELLQDYALALLIEGEPPTGEFQRQVLVAEKEAFTSGYHKAFTYWAGPCSICQSCPADGTCRNPRDARPSMEGAGIDVFETARRAGFKLRTLAGRDGFVKYYGLLLLE